MGAWWKDLAQGVGRAVVGGGGAPPGYGVPPGYGGAPGGMPLGVGYGYPSPTEAAAARGPLTVSPYRRTEAAGPFDRAGGSGATRGLGGRILGYMGEHPEVPLGLAGVGASIYGAYQEGKADDRQAELKEEDMRRQWEREEQERRRRQAAYKSILARRGGG